LRFGGGLDSGLSHRFGHLYDFFKGLNGDSASKDVFQVRVEFTGFDIDVVVIPSVKLVNISEIAGDKVLVVVLSGDKRRAVSKGSSDEENVDLHDVSELSELIKGPA
jgi:hypothetical protein